jgi:Luciferase
MSPLPQTNIALKSDPGSGIDRWSHGKVEDAHGLDMTDLFATEIQREVTSWPGVVAAPHRFGGLEFRVGRRELGHLHGSRLADLPFPIAIRKQLVGSGRAERHHILPESGWVSVRIRNDHDVRTVIDLFRLNYERPWLRGT